MLESRNWEILGIYRLGKVPEGRQWLEQLNNLSVAIEISLLHPYDLVSRSHRRSYSIGTVEWRT